VVSLIHAIFDWAMAADLVPEMLNPARLKKLGKLLPKRQTEVRHNRFVALDQLPAFMAKLQIMEGNLARAVEFVIHSGLRQNEVQGLTWDMVDLPARSILIPGANMKAKKPHAVFLSDRAYEIVMGMLPQRRQDNGRVFPGGAEDGGFGLRSPGQLLSHYFPEAGAAIQLHGARASFKTWATSQTLHRRELIELCLAHTVGSAVESAYLHVDAPAVRAARQAIYRDWSAFLTGGPALSAPNILPFRATA
jgi:integrase